MYNEHQRLDRSLKLLFIAAKVVKNGNLDTVTYSIHDTRTPKTLFYCDFWANVFKQRTLATIRNLPWAYNDPILNTLQSLGSNQCLLLQRKFFQNEILGASQKMVLGILKQTRIDHVNVRDKFRIIYVEPSGLWNGDSPLDGSVRCWLRLKHIFCCLM